MCFFQTPFFIPLPTASILSLIVQGGPIKPKVVTSTKDDKRKSKNIDAEKIVLDGGEVRGEGREKGSVGGLRYGWMEMMDNNVILLVCKLFFSRWGCALFCSLDK